MTNPVKASSGNSGATPVPFSNSSKPATPANALKAQSVAPQKLATVPTPTPAKLTNPVTPAPVSSTMSVEQVVKQPTSPFQQPTIPSAKPIQLSPVQINIDPNTKQIQVVPTNGLPSPSGRITRPNYYNTSKPSNQNPAQPPVNETNLKPAPQQPQNTEPPQDPKPPGIGNELSKTVAGGVGSTVGRYVGGFLGSAVCPDGSTKCKEALEHFGGATGSFFSSWAVDYFSGGKK